jgi:hypothetical protein
VASPSTHFTAHFFDQFFDQFIVGTVVVRGWISE